MERVELNWRVPETFKFQYLSKISILKKISKRNDRKKP